MSGVESWKRAEALARRWDLVWEMMEEAYELVDDSFWEEPVSLKAAYKEEGQFKGRIATLLNASAAMAEWWRDEAERRGRAVLVGSSTQVESGE